MAHVVNAPPPTPIEPVTETHRLVILDGNGTKVRVVPDGGRYVLPSVAVPRWQRIAENLIDAVKTEWGEEIICLSSSDIVFTPENGQRISYQITEHWRANGSPQVPTRWEPVATLSEDSFADHSDYSAIVQSVAECEAGMRNPATPFAGPGWFRDLRDWVETAIKPRGLHISENFQQLNASPSFSLVRFETDGPAVWFKAVGEPNRREFAITGILAELFPNYLPPILGIRPDLNAWLAQEAIGTNLGEILEVTLWEQAAASLAKLQIESIDNRARVLAVGARDQRGSALSNLVQPFVEAMVRLMEQQTRVPPVVLGRKDLLRLGDRIAGALDSLQSLRIPDTLGHADLNPWNIVVSPHSCVFLDWAEAYVGNPFFSFQYLLEHFRHTKGTDTAAEARIIESYCKPWRPVVSSIAISEALGLTSLLAVFAYAVGSDAWSDETQSHEQATAGYLRSLTRRMNRESSQVSDWRSPCLV